MTQPVDVETPKLAAATNPDAPTKASRRRVLVVEDHLDSMHSLVVLLREMGHEVDFAINGYAALEAVERTKPEFVLLDLGLPGLDGFRVCETIKASPALAPVRVVAITGYSGSEYRARALAAGCEHFVTKPVGAEFFEKLLG